MTEKRFTIIDKQFISYYGGDGHQISDGECKFWLWHNKEESQKVCDKLNNLIDENEQLKQTISKIDFAIIRKYDNSLENLLDEVYDGEYNNWIQKQLLRAKKLNGDLE